MRLDPKIEILKEAVQYFNKYVFDRNKCLANGGTDSDTHAVEIRNRPRDQVLVRINLVGWTVEFVIGRLDLIKAPQYSNGWPLRTLTLDDLRHAVIRSAA